MKAIVTGATGFVGGRLVDELLCQRDEVTVIVRNRARVPREWNTRVHIVEASLGQLQGLEVQDFFSPRADVFFHFAWDGTSGNKRADVCLQLQNAQFACDAVKLAGRLQCGRFINAGSIMEYEAMQYISADGALPGMGNIYSTAKLAADFMAKTVAAQEGIDYINTIISNIYGAGERSARFLNTTLRKMLNHEAIPLTHGEQMYDFIYVSDAVKAIAFAGKKGEKNASYYIGNARQHPLKEFILQMKEVTGSQSQLLFGEVPFAGATLSYREFDTEKLTRMGCLPSIDFAQGVNLTKKWMLEEEREY